MHRYCFFCHDKLSVRQQYTVFCSTRCQQMYARMKLGHDTGFPTDGADPAPRRDSHAATATVTPPRPHKARGTSSGRTRAPKPQRMPLAGAR